MRQPFTRAEAHKARAFTRLYRCSACWGPLVERIDGEDSYVECAKDDDKCDKTGFVTAAYVERRRVEDHGDTVEARSNLPFLKADGPGDPDQIIRDLTGG